MMYVSSILFILMLPFCCVSSQVFRYYLKYFLLFMIGSLNALVLIPVFIFKMGDIRNVVTTPISSLLGMKWILKGREHLEKDESCIIVANHQSSLDILGMFDIWSIMGKCTVLARKEVFYVWPIGLAAWLAGIIFIDRANFEKARKTMQETGEKIKTKNMKLWIFPEGERYNTGEIQPFKKGAFHLAINFQLPILPVVYSRYYFLDNKNRRFDNGKIIITALPPIPTKGMTSSDVDKLIERTREVMIATFHETCKQVMGTFDH